MGSPTAVAHQPVDPTLKPATAETTKEITLEATDTTTEIAPGVKLTAWTFGGSVPGPVLHVRQGDSVHFTLVNKSAMAHSLDFHAARTAPSVNYKILQPGETYSYTWKATDPGVFMYHCGAPPMLEHIAEGMYGAIIVDPVDQPLPKVDHEYVFVQSEFYLGQPTNGAAMTDMQKALSGNADLVVFNGYSGQYADQPIQVKAGDKIRVYVVNAGPDHFSAFHVVGTLFDHVYASGNPANDLKGIQTWTIAPGEGDTFDFTLADPGNYPMVSHDMADMTHGAMGVFKVVK